VPAAAAGNQWVLWTGIGPTSLQDIGIASGGPLGQLSLVVGKIAEAVLSVSAKNVSCKCKHAWLKGPYNCGPLFLLGTPEVSEGPPRTLGSL